jgi:hypothetical protein
MKRLFLITILLLFNSLCFAQELFKLRKNTISIHVTQLFVREIQLSYERKLTGKLSIEGTLGTRIHSKGGDYDTWKVPLGSWLNYEKKGGYMPFTPFANGYIVALALKTNFTEHLYLSINPFFRYNSFEKRILIVPDGGDRDKYILRSEEQFSLGTKLLFGVRIFKNESAFVVDVFSGVGVRNNWRTVTDYGESSNSLIQNFPEPVNSRTSRLLPSLHLGVKAGFRFI